MIKIVLISLDEIQVKARADCFWKNCKVLVNQVLIQLEQLIVLLL